MPILDVVLLLVASFSVWLPVVVGILARRSPVGVRVVLVLSGIASGIYGAATYPSVSRSGGFDRGWGLLLIPFKTTVLSFYLAFTGVCLLLAARYVVAGRATSFPGFVACGLVMGNIALGIFVVFPFLVSPVR